MDEPVRILCVDDEINVLRAVERNFIDDDFEIIKATSGEEGLEILKSISPIQLVIADYRMPGMTGVEFLAKVRKLCPDTIRIVLSGYADTASVVAAINEGQIYKFIPKPWNPDELKTMVDNALERYQLNKRNKELAYEAQEKNQELNCINADLERDIAEKTVEIVLQNRILLQAQTILHNLPAAVITANAEGIIIQRNAEAEELFGHPDLDCPGAPLKELLPEEVFNFISSLPQMMTVRKNFVINGRNLNVTSGVIDGIDNSKQTVLVFMPSCI
jgi:two-component system, NtrC family, sensor kinase